DLDCRPRIRPHLGGENDQEDEDQSRGPDAAGCAGGNQSQGAETDGYGLNPEAGDGSGAGGALAAAGGGVDFFGSIEREQVSRRQVHDQSEDNAGEGRGYNFGGGRAGEEAGAS